MKLDRPSKRKAFFIGLLLTGAGIFLAIYSGWNEATLICVVIGPLLLFCCLVLAPFSRWMARSGASRLPEGWDTLSSEAKHDYVRKRAIDESDQGNVAASISLSLMRLNDAQKHHFEESSTERDD